MPFTFAHPAAILPLRRYGDASALVIGSLIPDTGYLLLLELPREHTHGLTALLLFCLPAGLVAFLLYHLVLREPFIAIAPDGVRLRMAEHTSLPMSWRGWAQVVVSILVGAASHVMWDDLTHMYVWVERVLPGTAGTWFTIGDRSVGWYVALRHGSAVIALLALSVWALWKYRRTVPRVEPGQVAMRTSVRLVLMTFVVITAMLSAVAISTLESGLYEGHGAAGRGARASVGALTASLLAYAAAWHLWRRVRRRKPDDLRPSS